LRIDVKKEIKVQANAESLDRLDKIFDDLTDSGMDIQQKLPMLGHFRGLIDQERVDALRQKMDGIATVDVIGDEGTEEPKDFRIS
jgi:hypothetical protein